MTRIIGGSAGGRHLLVPPGRSTRPTSDRAREGLFNTLSTRLDLTGARFADLFAGTGAVGLEALSRGASHALLVDRDVAAVRALRRNVAALGLAGAEVVQAAVARVVQNTPGNPYDVIFLDPPYAMSDDELGGVLANVRTADWLTADGVCVVERSHRSAPVAWPEGMCALRDRRYGEGVLWYGIRS
ncbi:16S rRNA (guanine(966)-N(2))-methyltransferase RsmD [Frankia sp. AgB32]|uniref:16S rRNA (guanine(966)-N(2))-methyltransferase RsmD n=1 Tax=Frankia sp. AgB32 TaxID=631119 RepID=UPI00200CC939|nr:16S rRNA (guanine(966)-N(2))-methyltransferase RsmD [Frankia sp. AgB32]MCK9894656.1 16S rRNA (guanine(966)-N(2))-methyltransferase RsmD [Frankia sp. AgB32]